MKAESILKPVNGYIMLLILIILIGIEIAGIITYQNPILVILIPFIILIGPGFYIVNPNCSKVMLLFGAYKGTVKENGFFWVNPFYKRIEISLRARNFDSERIKVNDKVGNPILISIILVWKVKNTYKAAFEVDDYDKFVRVQSDAAVRKYARKQICCCISSRGSDRVFPQK